MKSLHERAGLPASTIALCTILLVRQPEYRIAKKRTIAGKRPAAFGRGFLRLCSSWDDAQTPLTDWPHELYFEQTNRVSRGKTDDFRRVPAVRRSATH